MIEIRPKNFDGEIPPYTPNSVYGYGLGVQATDVTIENNSPFFILYPKGAKQQAYQRKEHVTPKLAEKLTPTIVIT